MLNALVALFLYILIATVIVLAAIMIGISIWWLRQASSVIPWMSLAIAPCFIAYAVHLFLKPTLVEALVLAGVVFFSVQLVMETCPSRQLARRVRHRGPHGILFPDGKDSGTICLNN